MAPPLPAGYGPRATPGMRIMGTAAPPKPFFVQSTMLARCATRQPAVPARRVAASQALRAVTLGAAAASVLLGCGTPGVRGVAGTAPAPNVLWTPPRQPAAAPAAAPPELDRGGRRRAARRRLDPQRDPAECRAGGRAGLFPVPRHEGAARRAANDAHGGADESRGRGATASGGPRHDRRRAAGEDRPVPGPVGSPADAGRP